MARRIPTFDIWLKKDAPTTDAILDLISKHVREISKTMILKPKYLKKSDYAELRKKGVTSTPAMVVKGKVLNFEEIMKFITPATKTKERLSHASLNHDEMVRNYNTKVIWEGEDDDESVLRSDEIMRKMAAMQKKRPRMEGVPERQLLSGGRKVVSKKMDMEFDNDDDFSNASGRNNQGETPSESFFTEEDGEMLLENYKNSIADEFGRKANNKPIRWSH